MINVSNGYKHAVINGSVTGNELDICVFAAGENSETLHIRNNNIVSESLEMTHGICDESDIKFGGCIAGSFEVDISSKYDITRRYITVYCTQSANAPLYPGVHYPGQYTSDDEYCAVYPSRALYSRRYAIFSGEVYSCRLSKNRLTRRLIAYDRFYWRGRIECSGWYKSLYNGRQTITLGELRQKTLKQYAIRQQAILDEDPDNYDYDAIVELPGDDFPVYKLDVDELTVQELLRMIAEFCGVFMFFNGSGNIEYAAIGQTISQSAEVYDYYIDADAEEVERVGFDCIYTKMAGAYDFVQGQSDQEHPYYLFDNDLITNQYKSPGETPDAAHNFQTAFYAVRGELAPFFDVTYRPFELRAESRLWLQPGDPIQFDIRWFSVDEVNGREVTHTQTMTVRSFMFSRRIKGIQAMVDELSAQGEIDELDGGDSTNVAPQV